MSAVSSYFLPRDLHPAAWWVWALGLAVAASRTVEPWILVTILLIACYVVVARRTDAPWAMSFRLYLWLGALIIVLRVAFRVVFGGGEGDTVLLDLPQIPLPSWTSGVTLLGPVTWDSVYAGFCDGLRLATMVICLGAANALANPKRLLKSLPSALYEVGAAVVVALSVFPQLAESILRVRRARKLRGDAGTGVRALRSLVIPVLEDALDRSMLLASSMDSRGYGRIGDVDRRTRRLTGALMLLGLVGLCIGIYATNDRTIPRYLGTPMLAAGVVLAAVGFVLSGRRVRRTRYRPDRWRTPELVTAACGVVVAATLYVGNPQSLEVSTLVGVLIGVLPAWLTPPGPSASGAPAARERLRSEVAA